MAAWVPYVFLGEILSAGHCRAGYAEAHLRCRIGEEVACAGGVEAAELAVGGGGVLLLLMLWVRCVGVVVGVRGLGRGWRGLHYGDVDRALGNGVVDRGRDVVAVHCWYSAVEQLEGWRCGFSVGVVVVSWCWR